MVGVQLSGGLGNQMFEYALYLKLKSMGKDVRIDDVTCYGAQEKQRVNQLSVFGVSPPSCQAAAVRQEGFVLPGSVVQL